MAVLIITHREDMVAGADVASIMCLGTIIYSGDPAEAEQFYRHRCQPHAEALGAQSWKLPTPQQETI